jgi:hypothetical protein
VHSNDIERALYLAWRRQPDGLSSQDWLVRYVLEQLTPAFILLEPSAPLRRTHSLVVLGDPAWEVSWWDEVLDHHGRQLLLSGIRETGNVALGREVLSFIEPRRQAIAAERGIHTELPWDWAALLEHEANVQERASRTKKVSVAAEEDPAHRDAQPPRPPTDTELDAWIVHLNSLLETEQDPLERERLERQRDDCQQERVHQQAFVVLERWGWGPVHLSRKVPGLERYISWPEGTLEYDSKSTWSSAIRRGLVPPDVLEALIRQVAYVLDHGKEFPEGGQRAGSLKVAPGSPRPADAGSRVADGSRMKANAKWRHEMRLTDADMEIKGGNRAQSRARQGWTVPESRQTLANHERWWAELRRDNPDLAAD